MAKKTILAELHTNPLICAGQYPPQQVDKAIREVRDVLLLVHGGTAPGGRKNVLRDWYHWAATSRSNYRWLQRLGYELCARWAFIQGMQGATQRHPLENDVVDRFRDPPGTLTYALPTPTPAAAR
jgi:hypothetical protein